MTKHYYKVAGLVFSLSLPEGDGLCGQISNYQPFKIEGSGSDGAAESGAAESGAAAGALEGASIIFELEVQPWDEASSSIKKENESQTPYANFEEEDKIITLYRKDSGGKIADYDFHFFTKISKRENIGILRVTNDFSKGVLWADGSLFARQFSMNNSLMMMYAFAGAGYGALLQHASVIKLGDASSSSSGFCFLGKSGTGKSTHSSLWLKNIPGTSLLNDDNPALRVNAEGVPCVYGTPWSGKTPCYKNDFVKLGGFVDLHQAPHNKIRKLQVIEAYAALLPTFSNLKWERYVADGLNNTVTELIKKVPVFSLECLPDADAAFTSYKALTGKEIDRRIAEEKKGERIAEEKNNNHIAEEKERKTAKGYEVFDAVAELVDEKKTVKITVRGNSMLPFIFNGRDQVELQKQSSYKVGDIVLARMADRFVLHRIWKFDGENVILHGDGNPLKKKEKMPVTDIVAKTIAIYFNGKKKCTDAPWQKFKYKIWELLLPFRRVLLGIYRRLPYYKKNTRLVRERDAEGCIKNL